MTIHISLHEEFNLMFNMLSCVFFLCVFCLADKIRKISGHKTDSLINMALANNTSYRIKQKSQNLLNYGDISLIESRISTIFFIEYRIRDPPFSPPPL